MDSFFLSYRDPLFGVILFLILLFVVAASSTLWSLYSTRRREESLKRFARRFAHAGLDEEAAWLLHDEKAPIQRLIYLASIYDKSGEQQRAIKLYLTILEFVHEPSQKQEVLELLGRSYFKAGFLQRSKELFLEVLRHYPRNPGALTTLMYVYENLQEFERALEILEPLEELGVEVALTKAYLQAQRLIHHATMGCEEKSAQLEALYGTFPALARLALEYWARNDHERFWKHALDANPQSRLDLFWHKELRQQDFVMISEVPSLMEIYGARGDVPFEGGSGVFELDALLALGRCGTKKGWLSFEYVCTHCKQVFPLGFHRCPGCMSLLSLEPLAVLEEERREENRSLL